MEQKNAAPQAQYFINRVSPATTALSRTGCEKIYTHCVPDGTQKWNRHLFPTGIMCLTAQKMKSGHYADNHKINK